MASCPLGDLGKPVTKSIHIRLHFHSGMGSGCSSLKGYWCSALICWQVKHCSTNWAISLHVIPPISFSNVTIHFSATMVHWVWGTMGFFIISFFNAKSFGTQSLFPNLKIPSLDTLNPSLFPSCTYSMIFTICVPSTYELLIFSIKVGCIVKLAIKTWKSPMTISIHILSKSLIISF